MTAVAYHPLHDSSSSGLENMNDLFMVKAGGLLLTEWLTNDRKWLLMYCELEGQFFRVLTRWTVWFLTKFDQVLDRPKKET